MVHMISGIVPDEQRNDNETMDNILNKNCEVCIEIIQLYEEEMYI